MLKGLSTKQYKILDYYKKFITENGNAPTYSEASKYLNISISAIHKHITNLEKLGYLKKDNKGTIFLSTGIQKYNVLGEICCGNGIDIDILPYDEFSEEIEVPSNLLKSNEQGYILKAKGDSMEGLGIHNGDYLIIRNQSDVNDGDVAVVIMLDDYGNEKATLKQVLKKPQSIILKPKNSKFSPITLNKNVEIRGKLVGFISSFE